MRHAKSVHREQQELVEAAEDKGFADGVNACLAWLVEHQHAPVALLMRADFVDQSENQEPAS